MIAVIRAADGSVSKLPPILEWKTEHTDGTACDSAEVTFTADGETLNAAKSARELVLTDGGRYVFYGITDETVTTLDEKGLRQTVRARGFAAKMMRHELRAAQYRYLSAEEAAARFCLPCGIRHLALGAMRRVETLTVTTGMTCWQAFCGFCLKSEGCLPRFTEDGTLVPARESEKVFALTEENGILKAEHTVCRYGVTGRQILVTHGGEVARSLTGPGEDVRVGMMPTDEGNAAWVPPEVQIRRSAQKLDRLRVTLAGLTDVSPCDRIAVVLPKTELRGAYTVRCVGKRCGENGMTSELELEGVL